jgi:hypothetical protein
MEISRNGIVVTVSKEVIESLVLARLIADEKPSQPTVAPGTLPRIGAEIAELGGFFAGIARGKDGAPDYYLILGPEAPSKLQWQPAVDWAAGITHLGFADFSLPTRKEQALLFANVPEHFQEEAYWSGEQRAGYADGAWSQDFGYGNQDGWHKGNGLRVRAVRRVPIQAT